VKVSSYFTSPEDQAVFFQQLARLPEATEIDLPEYLFEFQDVQRILTVAERTERSSVDEDQN
jgi:hypothetical protein